MNVHNQRSCINRISLGLIFCFIILYIVNVFPHLQNIPKANDDLKIFLFHFFTLMNKPDFSGIFHYLFLINNKLHIKLDARFITLLSYFIFGSINYKFILISGHLLYLYSLYFLKKILSEFSALEYLPVVILFTLPSYVCASWSVAVWGYYSQMFLLILIGYFVKRQKTIAAISLCLLSTFTLATGFLSFLSGILFLSYKVFINRNKKNTTQLIIWIIIFLVSLFSLALFVHDTINNGSNDIKQGFNILAFSNYMVVFLFNFLQIIFDEIFTLTTFAYLLIILTISAVAMYLLKSKKNIDLSFMMILILTMILIGHGVASSFFRYNPESYIQSIPLRYELFSIIFACFLVIIMIYCSKSLLTKCSSNLFVYFTIFIAIFLSYKKHLEAEIGFNRFDNLIANKLINSLVENEESKKQYYINTYIKNGLYNPPYNYLRNDDFKLLKTKNNTQLSVNSLEHIHLLSNLKSEYFILLEFYTTKTFSGFDLIVNEDYVSEIQLYTVNELANFKTFKQRIPKEIYNDKNGYQIQFPTQFMESNKASSFKLLVHEIDGSEFKMDLN